MSGPDSQLDSLNFAQVLFVLGMSVMLEKMWLPLKLLRVPAGTLDSVQASKLLCSLFKQPWRSPIFW